MKPGLQPPQHIESADPEQLNFPIELGRGSGAPDVRHLRQPGRRITAINSYPLSGKRSLLATRILAALAEHAKVTFSHYSTEERQRSRSERGTPLFSIRVGQLRELMEQSSKDTQRIFEAINQIHDWKIQWELVQGEGDDARVVRRFSSVVISTHGVDVDRVGESQSTTIHFEFPYDVLLLMLEQRPRTQIDLRVMNEMGSNYAATLYDQCVPYFGTPEQVTPWRPSEDWIAILAGAGRFNNSYRDFKRYVLKPGISWLEKVASCPFTVELDERTAAKGKITHVRFRLVKKEQSTLDLALPPPTWSSGLLDMLTKTYEITGPEIAQMAVTHTAQEITEAIDRDGKLHARGSGSARSAVPRKAYLIGLIKNVQLGRKASEEPDVAAEMTPTPAVADARARALRLRPEFEAARNVLLLARLERQPKSRVDVLRSAFMSRAASGLLTNPPAPPVLKAGWKKGNQELHTAFATWLAAREPEVVQELLPLPEEHDFGTWLLAHQAGAATTNNTTEGESS